MRSRCHGEDGGRARWSEERVDFLVIGRARASPGDPAPFYRAKSSVKITFLSELIQSGMNYEIKYLEAKLISCIRAAIELLSSNKTYVK